jgi:hypothetical protein
MRKFLSPRMSEALTDHSRACSPEGDGSRIPKHVVVDDDSRSGKLCLTRWVVSRFRALTSRW